MVKYDNKLPLFSLHIPKSGGTSFQDVLIEWFTLRNKQVINIQNHPNLQIKGRWFIERGLPQVAMGDHLLLHYKNHSKKDVQNIIYKLNSIRKITKHPICIHGHFSSNIDGKDLFHFYPNAQQFIAFLRDPLQLHLSMFHYHEKLRKTGGVMYKGVKSNFKSKDIDQWFETRKSHMLDFIPFDFNTDNFKDIIKKYFVYIGVTENFQSSLNDLADLLNKPRLLAPVKNISEKTYIPSELSIRKFKENNQLEYAIYDYVVNNMKVNKVC